MSRIEEALKKAASRKQQCGTNSRFQEDNLPSENQVAPQAKSVQQDKYDVFSSVKPIKVDNPLLATLQSEKTQVVEEYNKLRSTIIALTKGESLKNTLLITSTISEEGKSMTALNLAISLAREHDHTVLLVDTDLRRPSVHKFLGLEPKVGLVHCLRDNLPIEDALVKTGIGKLVVLPAGEAVDDPVDMLSSSRMKNIIQELKERYDERYVIFDTPPALPFADAGVLAANVDSILFVVREGHARKDDIFKTLKEFKNRNLLGVVYNDARTFMKKNDYYYYYSSNR